MFFILLCECICEAIIIIIIIIPTGFSVYRKDRGSRGGGVLIAVNDSVSSSLLPQSPTDLEVIASKLGKTIINLFCAQYTYLPIQGMYTLIPFSPI